MSKEEELFEGLDQGEKNEAVADNDDIEKYLKDEEPIEKPKTKPKKAKRVVDEATKARLREQLKKGRETSARNRAEKALAKKIAKEDEMKARAEKISKYHDDNNKSKKMKEENESLRKRLEELEKRISTPKEHTTPAPAPPKKEKQPPKPKKVMPPPTPKPTAPVMTDAQRSRFLLAQMKGF